MSVYKAINAVQADLSKEGIGKDRSNQSQGYKFRGIDDVYNALAPLLAKHGLCVLPRCLSRDVVERVNAKGTALFYVTVSCEFDFVFAEDGSKHTVGPMYGEAMDSGDKATNKAMSAAYKYACMQAFSIPTEGDNDADAHTHEVRAKVISPVKEAIKSVDSETIAKAAPIAASLVDLYNASQQGDSKADYSALELVEPMDSDMRVAVWNELQAFSKVRAWIKKIMESNKKAA